jgi:hypothetical protein
MMEFGSAICPATAFEGDHPSTGATSAFGLALHTVEIRAPDLQPTELKLGILELAFRNHLLDRSQALDLACDDRDLLVEFARLLLLRRSVGQWQGRAHEGQHVTGLHRSSEGLEPAGGGTEPPAYRSLNEASGIGIGDDPPRQLDRPAMWFDFREDSAQAKDALRRLRHEQRAIRKTLRDIAQDIARGRIGRRCV